MSVRSGRVLPSVIVGALVTGALALGAGTAGAAGTCTSSDGETFLLSGSLERGADGGCEAPGLLGGLAGALRALGYEVAPKTTQAVEDALPSVTLPPTTTPPVTVPASPGSGSDASGANASQDQEGQRLADQQAASQQTRAQQVVVRPPSALPAPDVRSALVPAVSAPGGLAARVPALRFGTFDPSLLRVPAGSPLRTLTGVTPGSPVTTSSDVQAMAFDDLPGGLGTPSVVGVLILAGLAGFALRHRVLRRVRVAAAAETEETPVRAAA